MLSHQLNPAKCLVKTPYVNAALEKIAAENNVNTLIARLCTHATNAQAELLRSYLPGHIGSKITFSSKPRLRRYLSIIAAVLNDEVDTIKLSKSAKAAVLEKLTEDISACTPGYLNRAYIVIGSFNQPKSIDEVLCAYRLQLVEKAFVSRERKEVHAHHRFHVVANAMGYAIPYDEVADPYVGAFTDSQIRQYVEKEFKQQYTPSQIMAHFWEQAMLHDLGYVGKKDDYKFGVYNELLAYFRVLFKNPELTVPDCFVVDYTTFVVRDINWAAINSHLLDHFVSQDYFHLSDYKSTMKCKAGAHKLTFSYPDNEVDTGIITYYAPDGKKLTGFLYPDASCIVNFLPKNLLKIFTRQIARECQRYPVDKLIYLHNSGLIDFDTLLPKVVGQIKSLDDYLAITPKLNREKCQAVFDIIKDDIVPDFTTEDDFVTLARKLTGEQLKCILQNPHRIARLVSVATSLRTIKRIYSASTDKDVRQTIFDALSHQIAAEVIYRRTILDILSKLTPAQGTSLCQLLQDKLPDLIARPRDFRAVIKQLDDNGKTMVFHFLKKKMVRAIRTGRHLADIASSLPLDCFNEVMEAVNIPSIIKTDRDFSSLMSSLDIEKKKIIYNKTQHHLPGLATSADAFSRLMQHLSRSQRYVLYHRCQSRFEGWLRSLEDLTAIMKNSSPRERNLLFDQCKSKLATLYLHRYTFEKFLSVLSLQQTREVCDLIANELPKLYTDIYDVFDRYKKDDSSAVIMAALQRQSAPLFDDGALKYVARRPDNTLKVFNAELTGLNDGERTLVAAAFRHIYQAYQASLRGPRMFKPHDPVLNKMDKFSDEALIAVVSLSLGIKPGSLLNEVWQQALNHATDYQSDPSLRQAIANWSQSRSLFFRPSTFHRGEPAVVPPAVDQALRIP